MVSNMRCSSDSVHRRAAPATPSSRSLVGALGALAVVLAGCATFGFTSDEGALKKQVSFDHDCPVEKVVVVGSMEGGMGQASFKVDACGQRLRYERMGTSYFDSAKGSPLDQAMGKSAGSATPSAAAPEGSAAASSPDAADAGPAN